jgi:hypothetical protein
MDRSKATALVERVLHQLSERRSEFPVTLIREVYVFGSFARGALQPGDVDFDIELDTSDRSWVNLAARELGRGRNPYRHFLGGLLGLGRGVQVVFNEHALADYTMTLLWRAGDCEESARNRLHGIAEDLSAGRAPRDAMIPQFEGLDHWIPRPYRELVIAAVGDGAVDVERLTLPDRTVKNPLVQDHLRHRWKTKSPLFRAGRAVFASLIDRGLDPGKLHLHGLDVHESPPTYFAGFALRDFMRIPHCLTDLGGQEWTEVLHPRTQRDLHALRFRPTSRKLLKKTLWATRDF